MYWKALVVLVAALVFIKLTYNTEEEFDPGICHILYIYLTVHIFNASFRLNNSQALTFCCCCFFFFVFFFGGGGGVISLQNQKQSQ